MKNLKALDLEHLKKWYQDWYTPNNAILVIVGDVETKATLELVKRYFAKIPAKQMPERNDVLEFSHVGYRKLEVRLPVQVPHLYLAWNVHSLATAPNPQDAYTLVIMKNILDSGITSRLHNNLVRKQKITTSVSVSYDSYSRGDNLFSISALPVNGVPLQDIEKALLSEIEQLKNTPVTSDEINRVITRHVADIIYSQDDIAGQARSIGTLEVNGLSHRILDQLPQHYAAVTPEDIQRVANKYFNRDNSSSMYILPEQEK